MRVHHAGGIAEFDNVDLIKAKLNYGQEDFNMRVHYKDTENPQIYCERDIDSVSRQEIVRMFNVAPHLFCDGKVRKDLEAGVL